MPNERGKGSGCKKSKDRKDERYKYLDTYNLSLLYDENFIYIWHLDEMTPEKKKSFYDSKIYLFYRNYIGLDYKLLNESKIKNVYYEFYNLREAKEEERLFYSRVSNKLNKYIFEPFGYASFIISFFTVLLACFFTYLIDISCTKDIIFYIMIPEIILVIIVIKEFLKIKKPERSIYEILDDIYNLCDENTKFGLDFIKKERIDITSIRSLNFYGLICLILIIIIFFVIIIILKYIIDKSRNKKCSTDCKIEEQNLLKEEEKTEIKKINELKNIVV